MNSAYEFFVLKGEDPRSLTSFYKSARGSLVISLPGDGLSPVIPWHGLVMNIACFSLETCSHISSLKMNLRGGCTESRRFYSQYVHIE